MKKITIISSSFREGNSLALGKAFKEGAEFAKNDVKLLELKDLNLKFCLGCLTCQKTGVCVLKDDINSLLDKISDSDVLVFATPIYYYSMAGQLKTFLDRLNPLYVRDNHFREIYLLSSCADTEESAKDIVVHELEGWMSCFPGTALKGTLVATGVTNATDISVQFVEEAYLMGRNA